MWLADWAAFGCGVARLRVGIFTNVEGAMASGTTMVVTGCSSKGPDVCNSVKRFSNCAKLVRVASRSLTARATGSVFAFFTANKSLITAGSILRASPNVVLDGSRFEVEELGEED